jgi:cell division protein FtsB
MKNKIIIVVAILVIVLIGFRLYYGLNEKTATNSINTQIEGISVDDSASAPAAVADTADFVRSTSEVSPKENAIVELNDALCEYNNLAVNGSIYKANRENTFEIAKEDEGIIFINTQGREGDNSKITFNIKDVIIEYGVSKEGTNDEEGGINQSKNKVIIKCKLEKKLENLSKKKLNGEAIDEDEYNRLYNDETTRSCIIENGENTVFATLYVYNKNHADKVMQAFTKLRDLF